MKSKGPEDGLHLVRTRPGDPAVLVCADCELFIVVSDIKPNECPGCGATPCAGCIGRLMGDRKAHS